MWWGLPKKVNKPRVRKIKKSGGMKGKRKALLERRARGNLRAEIPVTIGSSREMMVRRLSINVGQNNGASKSDEENQRKVPRR